MKSYQDQYEQLFGAIKEENLEQIEQLIKKTPGLLNHSCTVYVKDITQIQGVRREYLAPPLYVAILNGKKDSLNKLIELGADLNQYYAKFDHDSPTLPIIQAIYARDLDMVKMLTENGARINFQDNQQNSILINILNTINNPRTNDHPTEHAILEYILEQLEQRQELEPLINAQSNHFTTDRYITPLIESAGFRSIEATKLLLKYKADVNLPNERKVTALMRASDRYYWSEKSDDQYSINLSKLLLENNADINLISDNNNTSLKLALKCGNNGLVKLFIEYGIDLDKKEINEKLLPSVTINYDNMLKVLGDEGILTGKNYKEYQDKFGHMKTKSAQNMVNWHDDQSTPPEVQTSGDDSHC